MNYDGFLSRAANVMKESPIRLMGAVGARVHDLISFAPGYPDPATFPWEPFRTITGELLSGSDGNVLQYGPTRGYRPLLEALDGILTARGIASTFEGRLITTGSQQGLDLVARVLIDPGDVILVELPTYTGAIAAFRNAQADLIGVPQQADGIDLDALDATWSRLTSAGRRVKCLYVVPNFQNPTGLLIGLDKRRGLLDWAERRNVLIVEDDPYGDLYFPDATTVAETRPIKADDARGRVIYLGSFSKTLAPGFRVAWVVGPEPIVTKLEIAKQATDICAGALDQRVVHQAITRGILQAQGERLRDHYQHKRTVMEQALAAELQGAISWATPRGGFFLWATLAGGMDAGKLLPHAVEARVSFVIGSGFYVDGTGASTLRLSFSQPSPERLVDGVARLATAVRALAASAQDPAVDPPSALTGISSPRG
jgi:2-aminoadipate transaminase